MSNPADNQRLFEDQVRRLYDHIVFGTVATLINGSILGFILRTHVPRANLLIWLAFAVLVSSCRLLLHWRYRKLSSRYQNPKKWNAWFLATLFLAGILWGSAAFFLFPEQSIGHQAFIAFVTGGMVAGAVGAFTALISAFFIFSVPALLPIVIRFFLIGSEIHLAMGAMVLLFLAIISLTAIRMHKDILYQLSLRYEKDALVVNLQQEVVQRKTAQEELRREKEQVEEIVTRRTAELKSANLRLRAIINYAPLVIWAVDRKGVLIFCDGKGLEKIDHRAGEVPGKTVSELFDGNEALIASTQRVLNGEFVSNAINFKDAVFEIRYQPVKDAYDRLTGAIGVAMDVTEQTLAKEALRRGEEKYRELVENINDVLFVIDRKGLINYISPVVESVLGYRADELIGTCFFDYIFQQDLTRLQTDFATALEVSKGTAEYRFWSKFGELKWCRASSRSVLEGNQKIGIQGVLVDITRSKRLEEQLQRAQKMEALGTMAGGVAHDLNNMLSGIVSYPELLLLELPADSPLRQPLTTIKKSGENAAAIVQDLLTLARRGVATIELLNLNRIVEECLASPEIQSLTAISAGIRINAHLQADLFNIYGSYIHIFKSLTNLIRNAAEAMPQGGSIGITTATRYVDKAIAGFDTVKEGEYVVLGVADSGIGIAENDRARIFEPFYTKKIMGRSGSGLGMAVVWGTVKDHNGYIDIQSETGAGTRVDLFFPATRDQLQKARRQNELKDFRGRGQFVLVIDDMPLQREIATGMLRRLGYRFKALDSGEAALAFLQEHTADLIILDMIMSPGGMDGYETYRHILEIRPDQRAIIASGFSETEEVRKTQALGAGRYIKKPYTLATLGMAVKNELERSKNDESLGQSQA